MDYLQFSQTKPILYGQIAIKGKSKIGSFRAEWNHLTNSCIYHYYTPNNKKGSGGFTMEKAFRLFDANRLTTDPQHGDPANYL